MAKRKTRNIKKRKHDKIVRDYDKTKEKHLEKLADKMNVDRNKMPNNIVSKYGNGSGITVPLNICENISSKLDESNLKVILGGFGIGLTWSMVVCELKKMRFCEIINY